MSDYQIAMEGFTQVFQGTDDLIKAFKRDTYKASFQQFYLRCVPMLDAVENLYATVVEKDTMLGNMAKALTEQARKDLEAQPKRTREVFRINQSLVMAGYLYPTILQYGGASSKPLVEQIQAAWKEVFPKSNIGAAPYEDIEKGFHRKWCYITTAACQVRGMADDCYELNLLRTYRDTYMMRQSGGAQMIHDYYDVAPSIVKHIANRPDRDAIYNDIWDSYISPCIRDIENGDLEDCLNTYAKMVEDLKEAYFHLYPHVKYTVT